MSLAELLEKSMVTFDSPLTVKEIKDLFGYLVRKSDGKLRVGYSFETTGEISDGVPFEQEYVTGLTGHIWLFGQPEMAPFECTSKGVSKGTTDGSFSVMKFFTIPGYSLQEQPEGDVKVWGFVQEKVPEYFSQR